MAGVLISFQHKDSLKVKPDLKDEAIFIYTG